jgi:hypothetical protein
MTTRTMARVLVLSLFTAEYASAAPTAPPAKISSPGEAELHARSLKHRGAWLIGFGVPHLAVALGSVFWSVAIDAEQSRCARTVGCFGFEFAPPWIWVGVPFGIIGVVLTGVGLPLFVVGRVREQRLRRIRLMASGIVAQF